MGSTGGQPAPPRLGPQPITLALELSTQEQHLLLKLLEFVGGDTRYIRCGNGGSGGRNHGGSRSRGVDRLLGGRLLLLLFY